MIEDNLKARLALSGWEASVQTATLPDKSVRYRVRLGPYDNADELNRLKLAIRNGQQAIADLQEEARRAGVPPGWLR